MVDSMLRTSLLKRTQRWHEQRFYDIMGYTLPESSESNTANARGIPTILNVWLAETLLRSKIRRDAIQRYSQIQQQQQQQHPDTTSCPMPIIQVNAGDWYRPTEWQKLNGNINETILLMFDEEQMTEFMIDHFDALYRTIYQKLTLSEKIQLFGLAAVYYYGGVFFAPEIRDQSTLQAVAPGLEPWIQQQRIDCQLAMWLQSVNQENLSVLAATPRHSRIKCALQELLANYGGNPWKRLFRLMRRTRWDPTCEPRCCPLQNMPGQVDQDIITFIERDVAEDVRKSGNTRRYHVTISAKPGERQVVYKPKQRISQRLRNGWCSAGWVCNRCLRTPLGGSLHACRFFCRSCYRSGICSMSPETKHAYIVEAHVREEKNSQQKRIPRIIHQTYFELLTAPRYPHIHRLQNSWKASGWDYRFYTDMDCRNYIEKHYPDRFLEAYDALIIGAFRADLFRLLVLFREGGIYADIDTQLEADLDNFITTDLSFFVPRDVPHDFWPNSNFCLWNGLLGSAPGHPILAKAIEDIITAILNRDDYYDIERDMCSRDPEAEIWKLRTIPILILTGPCLLGRSVNAAIGKTNLLESYRLGWIDSSIDDMGDVLILLTDRHDLGETRFVDIDRNIILASTDQDRIAKTPIESNSSNMSKNILHYSKSESDIVGEVGVYKDELSLNERLIVKIRHELA
jgi:hypothetical protein